MTSIRISIPIGEPVRLAITIGVPILCLAIARCLEIRQIIMRLAQHPYREGELEVRVRNSAGLVEHTLDSLLRPRPVLTSTVLA
jgi:hypothetical protein